MRIDKLLVIFGITLIAASCSPGARHDGPPRAAGARPPAVEVGVSRALAEWRNSTVRDPEYTVHFSIRHGEKITGRVGIRFRLEEPGAPLQIDFAGERVESVSTASGEIPFVFDHEHIVVESRYLRPGGNELEIGFVPDEIPLHREDDHLYTLFVPAKARFVFPCFDQPDI